MRFDISMNGKQAVLAGAVEGRAMYVKLLSETNTEPHEPAVFFIDFSKVEVATASYLRESIIQFRDSVRNRRSKFYPVIANANEAVVDELQLLMKASGDAYMSCLIDTDNVPTKPKVIGGLEAKQALTFELVHKLGETDAGTLMSQYGESEGMKHTTAWNNRLAALASIGLIIEKNVGRSKRYRPILEGG